MSIGVRLILFLTIMVGGVMVIASYFILSEREEEMIAARQEEMYAHALSLQTALENLYSTGQTERLQELLKRLNNFSQIHKVVIYDKEGHMQPLPDSSVASRLPEPPEVRQVLATGRAARVVRTIAGRKVFSIFMPVSLGKPQRGVFEISQPLDDIAYIRRDMAIITSLLLAAIFLVVFAVTRYSLSRPIRELLRGARTLGRGDLAYRVPLPRGRNELRKLALEFNRMADNLAEQNLVIARKAEERIEMEREMRHKERLASVGYLAAGVAHEMGTSLNVIDARAEQMLSRPNAGIEVRQRNLSIIRSQVARIVHIVRQLLHLAHPYKLNRELVNLAGLVASALQRIGTDAANVAVEVEVDINEDIWIEVDQELMRQVFFSLCLNGVHAMSAGGRLRIETVETGAARDNSQLAAVRVSDTGVGIAPEHFAHIFDPFYTTKDVGKGMGLGLSVARRIIEEHGGQIKAANNQSGGATLTVYLPRSEALTAVASDALESREMEAAEKGINQNESTVTGG
ncbi:MAG: ATP-binding protein [Blastocatellia bacterium]|nr:ATP-binding protein [Blastocatellia bacterium]